jgi:hypothetical protein
MKTAWGWSAKLTRLIVLKDGTRLVTLGDVRAFILKQPEHIQERGSWQHATELMILAAERGGNIEAATSQIETLCFWKRGTSGNGTDEQQHKNSAASNPIRGHSSSTEPWHDVPRGMG